MLRDWCQAASNHQKVHACRDHSEPGPGVTLHRVWGSCFEGAASPVHYTDSTTVCPPPCPKPSVTSRFSGRIHMPYHALQGSG